ncbi:MAG TPA: thioesterase domain-containing protein, partial [Chloroflexota bacterium]|nr:thioesterase domain-containing protein [Chloroflexota bacterium]
RGFRVELGEIESVLAAQPDVQAVAVVARKHELGQTRLVAYAVPSGPLDTSALLAAARARLPEYMVPADVVLLDRLPLGPTGKLDVAALPAPAREARPAQATHQPPRDEVELTLRRLFQELLHTEEVGPSDNFFSLGGDSLLAVRLLARISNGFSVDLPLSCMWDGASVAYLADLVRGGATRSDAHSGLKWLRQGSKRPFFCAAPLDGNPFRFAQLAQHFDEDRPFVALKATWEDEWVGPEGTVESVAAAYIPELRLVQRHGPYLLGGYSFGGAVAYELARQLAATGEEVGLLAMIDCGPSHWSLSPRWKSPRAALNALANLPGWLSEAAGRSWREWHDSLRQELSMFRARFRAAPASEDPADLERLWRMDALPAEYRDFLRGCFRALVSYTPAPYDGSVTLLRARSQSLIRPPDRRLGWGPFVRGGVEVLDVPGTHLSSLREPNVRTVAAILNEHLRRADTSPLAA